MILILDNYDSFVENLARYCRELEFETYVKRNNQITLEEIKLLNPSHIIISPGPCTPNEAGISLEVIKSFKHIPILGVCLGHQAIGQAFGCNIIKAKKPMHGKVSYISHDQKTIFKGVASPLKVGRYHSLVIENKNIPLELEITSTSLDDYEIMSIKHYAYPIYGVQFHPESILTDHGYKIIKNFLLYPHI